MKIKHPILTAVISALALTTGYASAQSYPSRAVKIVVPFAASGPAHNNARFLAQRLQEEFKQLVPTLN